MLSIVENPDVKVIEQAGKTTYLIGTAHVSQASVDLVEKALDEIKPETVAVELCDSRYHSLIDPESWRKMDIFSVIRQGKSYVLMAQLILAAFQKKIGDKLEVKPGSEMLKAIEKSNEHGSEIVLADRDVKTTLKRAWSSLGLWGMTKMIASLVGSLFTQEEITEEEINRLKSSDVLDSMMEELSENLPGIRTSLIDERDKYLAQKISTAPGKVVVAVVGAGHMPGIAKYFNEEINLAELEEIPKGSVLPKIIAWLIPILIVGMIVYGFANVGADAAADMALGWALSNSIPAAIGALIALAHPFTIIAAFCAAPFTSLNPFIAAGWVAGLVEAWMHKPRVEDLENIADDISSVKGIWKNRVSKVLLVVALVNLGSMIGTAIGLPLVASFLK